MNVETALTYARKARALSEDIRYKDDKQMKRVLDCVGVVIEQLEEVSRKIKEQWVATN